MYLRVHCSIIHHLHKALGVCGQYERKVTMTGRSTGATCAQFGEYLMKTVEDRDLESKWDAYVKKG
ncbi:MAG: hypothetical protein EXR54_03555 [Dehalococcoidia bacterium]|nr:hypothetical protein [Dehalococcoidia bacterium]MSQ16630.1 hypothetical protein [Dehalococcoidia bacterium]